MSVSVVSITEFIVDMNGFIKFNFKYLAQICTALVFLLHKGSGSMGLIKVKYDFSICSLSMNKFQSSASFTGLDKSTQGLENWISMNRENRTSKYL